MEIRCINCKYNPTSTSPGKCNHPRGFRDCLSRRNSLNEPRGKYDFFYNHFEPKPKDSNDYLNVAKEVAELVVKKQEAYGDSFGKAGAVMRELYPNGIKPYQYDDMLTIVRMVDKLFRIATKKDAFGENPFKDILGYSLLAVVEDNRSNWK